MFKIIEQSVHFPVSPAKLFGMFLDSEKHSAMTGMPATIDPRPGGKFSAFDGMLEGTTLAIIPNQMIVQRWRSCMWKNNDLDSILVLKFQSRRKGCQLDLVHVNVPTHDFEGVVKGWPKYYWKPMRAYLKKRLDKAVVRLKK